MDKIDVKFERISSWSPRALGFSGILHDDEKILRIFRRAFFRPLQSIVGIGILAGGAAFLSWFFLPTDYWIIAAGFLVAGLGKSLDIFYHWYRNGILITDLNVIIVDWPKSFQRRSTRLDYWNIDEIQVEKIGVGAFFHNFGTLHFQKVNGGELIAFADVSRPHRTAALIEQFKEDMVDLKQKTESGALKELLSELVQTHVSETGLPGNKFAPKQERTKPKTEDAPEPPKRHKAFSFFNRQQGEAKSEKRRNIQVEKELDDTGGIEIEL